MEGHGLEPHLELSNWQHSYRLFSSPGLCVGLGAAVWAWELPGSPASGQSLGPEESSYFLP